MVKYSQHVYEGTPRQISDFTQQARFIGAGTSLLAEPSPEAERPYVRISYVPESKVYDLMTAARSMGLSVWA